MTVLVIGASGFLGKHLVAQMKNSGEAVIGTERNSRTDDGLYSIDLGVKDEYLKINSLVEQFKITKIVNLAASNVSPSDRMREESGQSSSFFENLYAVLSTFRDVGLLHIGTTVQAKGEDFYFAAKYELRNLLENTNVKNQIAILDLPKVVGPGEPLGRFTSNFMYSVIMNEEQEVLHPCHKRNFMSVIAVVDMITQTIKIWTSGGDKFPSHVSKTLSNYEVARLIIDCASETMRQVLVSHSPDIEVCDVCPADEAVLLVKPEFFRSKEFSYFLLEEKQSVEETLLQQFKNLSISPHKLINHYRKETDRYE